MKLILALILILVTPVQADARCFLGFCAQRAVHHHWHHHRVQHKIIIIEKKVVVNQKRIINNQKKIKELEKKIEAKPVAPEPLIRPPLNPIK